MAASLVDSVGAEMQHGEAELRAVLASSGVAGVHGTVRRPEAGKNGDGREVRVWRVRERGEGEQQRVLIDAAAGGPAGRRRR